MQGPPASALPTRTSPFPPCQPFLRARRHPSQRLSRVRPPRPSPLAIRITWYSPSKVLGLGRSQVDPGWMIERIAPFPFLD